jgi:hypothetical protein
MLKTPAKILIKRKSGIITKRLLGACFIKVKEFEIKLKITE